MEDARIFAHPTINRMWNYANQEIDPAVVFMKGLAEVESFVRKWGARQP